MQRKNGFTLIEMIIVIAVTGILVAIVAVPLSVGVRAYVTGKELLRVHEMGRLAMWRMERELRSLRKSSPSLVYLTVANSSILEFNDANQQSIEFSLVGQQLQRNNLPLADSVSALTFTYYDRDNNVLGPLPLAEADRIDVYRISIDFTITVNGENYHFRNQIFPRDLRN